MPIWNTLVFSVMREEAMNHNKQALRTKMPYFRRLSLHGNSRFCLWNRYATKPGGLWSCAILVVPLALLVGASCQSVVTPSSEDASTRVTDLGAHQDSFQRIETQNLPETGEDVATDSEDPGEVFPLSVRQMAIEFDFSCALTEGGDVYCWGQDNGPSFLSSDVYGDYRRAQRISELHDIVQVSVSSYGYACALERVGRIWCWGFNYAGGLGVDSQEDQVERPRVVQGITGATHIATTAGGRFFARMGDGSVHYWGGLLRPSQRVPNLEHTADLHSSNWLTCARLTRGGHACHFDALFYGFESANSSENMAFLRGGGSGVWCGLKLDRSLWCAGSNTVAEAAFPPEMSAICAANPNQYGFVRRWRCLREPQPVTSLQGVEEVAAGALTTCARLQDGTVWCWGGGFVGPGDVTSRFVTFGDGRPDGEVCEQFPANSEAMPAPFPCRRRPVQIVGLSGVTTIAVGYRHACAALATGGVRCWGVNDHGQLGDGTTTHRATPVPLRM